jgi:Na+(H+)/acetate symporter ActP
LKSALMDFQVEPVTNLKGILIALVVSTLAAAVVAAAQLGATSCIAVGPRCSGVPGIEGLLSILGWMVLGLYLRRFQLVAAALGAWTGFISAAMTWFVIQPIVSAPTLRTFSFDPLGASASMILWPIVGGISAFTFSRIRQSRLPLAVSLSLVLCFIAVVWVAGMKPAPAGMF